MARFMVESPHRKILHVDMDAFYASLEQRDSPGLRGHPVAVGYAAARGVVAAASYEARAFGVRSTLPSVTALRRCPDLVFAAPRFDVYKAVSQQIHAIFAEYTYLIQPRAVDSQGDLRAASLRLFRSVLPATKGIRLLGVTVSNFERRVLIGEPSLPLFGEAALRGVAA